MKEQPFYIVQNLILVAALFQFIGYCHNIEKHQKFVKQPPSAYPPGRVRGMPADHHRFKPATSIGKPIGSAKFWSLINRF
jgi:hypothetical protein